MVRSTAGRAIFGAFLIAVSAAFAAADDFDASSSIAELVQKILIVKGTVPAKPKIIGICDGRFTTLRAPFREAKNAHGVLWKVTSPNAKPSYLYATEHSQDPRVTKLLELALPYFSAADTIFTEVDMNESQQAVYLQRTVLPNSRLSSSLMPPELYAKTVARMQDYRVDADVVARMKLWALFSNLGRPPHDTALQLDQLIASEAAHRSKNLNGLQSAAEITDILDAIPMQYQVEMLKDAVCDYDDNLRDSEKLTRMYATQDIGKMLDYTVRLIEPRHVAYFMKAMVYDRSRIMADRLEPALRVGGVFAAMGAMHLPGDQGVLSLLQERGFTVTPVNLTDKSSRPAGTMARRDERTFGPGAPTLDGDIPRLVQDAHIVALWPYMKSLLHAPAGLPAPRIHFDVFSPTGQELEWTLWQEEWLERHPQFHHLRQAGQLGWFYPDSNNIQLSPSAFTVSYSIDPMTGLQKDFGGFGYLEAAHEMAHYIYAANRIPVEEHHRLLYCPQNDWDLTIMEQVSDFLGTQKAGSADFLRAAVMRVQPIYCATPEEPLDVKNIKKLLPKGS